MLFIGLLLLIALICILSSRKDTYIEEVEINIFKFFKYKMRSKEKRSFGPDNKPKKRNPKNR